MALSLGVIGLPVLANDPAVTPPSGYVFYYVVNNELRYKDSTGTVYHVTLNAESVQDIIGGILTDTATVDMVYDDANNQIKANVIQTALDHTQLQNIGTNTHAQIDSHISSASNPHAVTKSQVGLGNVDNTSDANKPVSTAQASAISAGDASTLSSAQTYADGAVSTHVAAGDPHPQYTTAAEAASAAPVQSVNGETGTLTNYAKVNQANVFSQNQEIETNTGNTALEINNLGSGDSLLIFRNTSATTPLWAVGADRTANYFRISQSNGLSTSVQMQLNSSVLDMFSKRIINVSDPVNAQDVVTKGWVEALASGYTPIFGANNQYFVDSTPFSTASGTYQNATTFTTASNPAGTYRINFQWNFTMNTTTSSAFFQLRVDGVDQLSSPMQVELKDVTDDLTYNAFIHVTFASAGTRSLQLRTATENGSTVTINTIRCEFWRVS